MLQQDDLISLVSNFLQQIAVAPSLQDLEKLKAELFGKKGFISAALAGLSKLPMEEKKSLGAVYNDYKNQLFQAMGYRKDVLEEQSWQEKLAEQSIDVTLPAPYASWGQMHPLTVVLKRAVEILVGMGFCVQTGPDVETPFYNFDALNVPLTHPARAPGDTFYIKGNLLRTHTSAVQIRVLQEKEPPLRVISFGSTYRRDECDATHTPMFHQMEMMVVEAGATMAHLKGCLFEFLSLVFQRPDLEMRLRPSFFPFTEPSAEVDIKLNGKWLELLGCGMIHPRVFTQCGKENLSGYAFGMGLERLAMLKYELSDIRDFYNNDQRWLNYFFEKN